MIDCLWLPLLLRVMASNNPNTSPGSGLFDTWKKKAYENVYGKCDERSKDAEECKEGCVAEGERCVVDGNQCSSYSSRPDCTTAAWQVDPRLRTDAAQAPRNLMNPTAPPTQLSSRRQKQPTALWTTGAPSLLLSQKHHVHHHKLKLLFKMII